MSIRSRERHQLRTEYFKALEETAKIVDLYVEGFIREKLAHSPELRDVTLRKYRFGKPKLRPAQVRWAYELAGGPDWTRVIPMCAAVEVKDTAYYCFDDIFDKEGDARTLPIAGGTLLTLANDMARQTPCAPAGRIHEALSELFCLDYSIASGALIERHLRGTDEAHYMRKAECYNYWQHILKIGAILGNASTDGVKTLGEIGKSIGTAYIIANDTYDCGKEEMEDFTAGIHTMPIIWALHHTSAEDKRTLESLLGTKPVPEQKTAVRRIIVRSGAIEHGKEEARKLCAKALKLLQSFPDTKARRMIAFSTTMTQRNKHYDALKAYEQETHPHQA